MHSKKKVLVFGGSGFLGINLARYCKNFDLILTYCETLPTIPGNWIKFNFSSQNKQMLSALIYDTKPDIIINCIALADVDLSEQLPEKANLLNTFLPTYIAEIAEERKIKFVQISTDHFKSRVDEPRPESTEFLPVNMYGNSKKIAEELVHATNANALILRTNFFGFSYRRNNTLLEKILNNMGVDQAFPGFSDVFFNPVSVIHLTKAIEYLCSINSCGFYNIASNTVVTKLEFARSVAKVFGFNPELIISSTSSQSFLQVDRPNYLALDSTKYSSTGAPKIPEVKEMLLELKEDTLWMDKLRS